MNDTAERGRFKGLRSVIGPLPDDTKYRVVGFLNRPSKASWDAVANSIVKGRTMWQIWTNFDSNAPRSLPSTDDPERWPAVPDPQRMREALVEMG